MRGVALCQLIPGATMVQIVTYIGYRVRGILGALTAAVAFVLPPLSPSLFFQLSISEFHSLWFVEALLRGWEQSSWPSFSMPALLRQIVLKGWKVILIAALSFFASFFSGTLS